MSGGPGILLFDEDFDELPMVRDPEVAAPVFSAAELDTAREHAARDARETALADAEASTHAETGRTLARIAEELTAARDEAASIAEQSAEAVARLLFDCFAAAFPALSARHGQTEIAAVMRAILPALHREPKIAIRVSPHLLAAMAGHVGDLDADLAARVKLIPTDAVAPGDARISWENGAATRDAMSLWTHIENILAPAGLLSVPRTVKEAEVVE